MTVYLLNGVGKIGLIHLKKKRKKENYTAFLHYTQNKLKSIKDENVSLESIKILEQNISNKTPDISCSNIFSDILPWARETKEKKTVLSQDL